MITWKRLPFKNNLISFRRRPIKATHQDVYIPRQCPHNSYFTGQSAHNWSEEL